MKPNPSRIIAFFLLLALVTGCGGISSILATPTPQPAATSTDTSSAIQTAQTTPSVRRRLRLWLPPQFDPASGTPTGNLLKARLEEFTALHPGLQIEVRIKAVTGPASLLESLIAANDAAPAALPDLVALPRHDLEAAALQGLLHPLEGLTTVLDDADWYAYARQMAHLQSTGYGLPFAGDALILLYRPAVTGRLSPDWNLIQGQGGRLAFPAADPQALFSLGLYLSAGGPTIDDQSRPTLDVLTLTSLLTFYRQTQQNGTIPYAVTRFQSDAQAWEAYNDQQTNMVVTWASRYLNEMPADSAALPLPGLSQTPYTLATGWLWALAGSRPEHQPLAAELAEFLVDSDFLAAWTAAAGYLPTRPKALSVWPDESRQYLVSEVILSAQLVPAEGLMLALGPVLQEAVLKVLKGQDTPAEAAQAAVESMK